MDPRPAAKHVLVVEDDRDVNTLICRYLGHRDFACSGAHSARQCLDALDAAAAPDLILIDLELPDLDGAELCRQIQQRADVRDVPVVLMTGYQAANQLERVRAAGASALMLKPFSPKELLAKIMELTHLPPPARAVWSS